jgi:hypothetical protein
MFDIQLGYTTHDAVSHWQLLFIFQGADGSIGCPDECTADPCTVHADFDDQYFECDKNDDFVSLSPYYAVHVVRNDEGEFQFQVDDFDNPSAKITSSDDLGEFDNALLGQIIDACAGVALPDEKKDENCQDWCWNAMKQVLARLADLEDDWEETMEGCAYD